MSKRGNSARSMYRQIKKVKCDLLNKLNSVEENYVEELPGSGDVVEVPVLQISEDLSVDSSENDESVTDSEDIVTDSGQIVVDSGQIGVGREEIVTNSGQALLSSEELVVGIDEHVLGGEEIVLGGEEIVVDRNEILVDSEDIFTGEQNTAQTKFIAWYNEFNPTRASANALLKILKSEGLKVPSDIRTLLNRHNDRKNDRTTIIRTVAPGTYYHLGLAKQLRKIPSSMLPSENFIVLDIGVDGLPLYKSSSSSLWPIIGRAINIEGINVFLIGTYLGNKKPYSVDSFLHDFLSELRSISENNLVLHNRQFNINIRAFICDTPARAFMCGIIGHNALIGCSKCYQIGKKIDNVTTFSTTSSQLRTDQDFLDRKQKGFHNGLHRSTASELELIGTKMITQFPLEPMHLVDLGVARKILLALVNRKNVEKITEDRKNFISLKLIGLSGYIPMEFQRKPRSLNEISRWKATEFRQFLLYTGIVVLKNIVGDNFYYQFLLLHTAYRLLSAPQNFAANINTANELLALFVENFPIVFGANSVTFNVHGLLHLCDSVHNMGIISSFSAYDFENYMQQLKKKIRKPSKILQQIKNKFSEADITLKETTYGFKKNRHGKIVSYKTKNLFLSTLTPDNFCCITPFIPIRVTGFLDQDQGLIEGVRLRNLNSFFDEPVNSMDTLGICTADINFDIDNNSEKEVFKVQEILFKMTCLPDEEKFVLIPLLHSYDKTLY